MPSGTDKQLQWCRPVSDTSCKFKHGTHRQATHGVTLSRRCLQAQLCTKAHMGQMQDSTFKAKINYNFPRSLQLQHTHTHPAAPKRRTTGAPKAGRTAATPSNYNTSPASKQHQHQPSQPQPPDIRSAVSAWFILSRVKPHPPMHSATVKLHPRTATWGPRPITAAAVPHSTAAQPSPQFPGARRANHTHTHGSLRPPSMTPAAVPAAPDSSVVVTHAAASGQASG